MRELYCFCLKEDQNNLIISKNKRTKTFLRQKHKSLLFESQSNNLNVNKRREITIITLNNMLKLIMLWQK